MKKMISYIFVGLVFILIVYCITFCFGKYIFDIFSKEGRESFSISIAFFSLFATFIGSGLGAWMAGRYSLKVARDDREFYISGKKDALYRKYIAYVREIYQMLAVSKIMYDSEEEIKSDTSFSFDEKYLFVKAYLENLEKIYNELELINYDENLTYIIAENENFITNFEDLLKSVGTIKSYGYIIDKKEHGEVEFSSMFDKYLSKLVNVTLKIIESDNEK
ncbi:hypothetical protein [Staphylococcus gallinarum]|uniref:hypothetical protein n=1 Tax=Staphylococcus gallinarum TaxID=1293 RepID=UPI001E54EC14|nr:hypothetical protein [Staphylococcus gallinarum]MCD8903070.1 hypothetical protein [Staphylococcus gallinarum]MEB6236991.1 hypothetical protein [Staphylococcus gallinarum]